MPIHVRKHFIEQETPALFETRGESKHYFAAGGPDVELVREYYAAGAPHGQLLYFSIGETWSQIAPALERLMRATPPSLDSHGYQLMPYGLPTLRRVLTSYVAESHAVPPGCFESGRCETAVASTGTRTAMYDFGKLVRKRRAFKGTPVVVTTLPSWDYRGVFEPLGYRVEAVPLRSADGFRPNLQELDRLLVEIHSRPDQELALVAINAQHNPTGVSWTEDETRHWVRRSIEAGASILLDDPYFAIHDPDLRPTSSLRILLEELRADTGRNPTWLAVRSLGKQFNCNGWAIGAMTSTPETLRSLCNEYLFQRGYPYGSYLQSVMAIWLQSAEASAFLQQQNASYRQRKQLVRDFLVGELGFDEADVHTGDCTSYMLQRVPPAYRGAADGSARFQRDVFRRTGVMVGVGSLAADPARISDAHEYVRWFVGPAPEHIAEALTRWRDNGIDASFAG